MTNFKTMDWGIHGVKVPWGRRVGRQEKKYVRTGKADSKRSTEYGVTGSHSAVFLASRQIGAVLP